jgi:hypothetical protein
LADFPTTDTYNSEHTAIALETHSGIPKYRNPYTKQTLNMKVAAILALIPAAFAVINNEARDS